MGVVGRKSTKKNMATAGLILSIVGLVATIVNSSIGAYQGATAQLPGTLTITGIPSVYNGNYMIAEGYVEANDTGLFAAGDIETNTMNVFAGKISNGSVTLKVWRDDGEVPVLYTGSGVAEFEVVIINTNMYDAPGTKELGEGYVAAIFTNGIGNGIFSESLSQASGPITPANVTPRHGIPESFPASIKKSLMSVPEDVLVGIGVAKSSTFSQSRILSEARARVSICDQMAKMMLNMIRDFTLSSEVESSASLSFTENIMRALVSSTLVDSIIIDQDSTADGSVWTVVWLNKADVLKELNQAQAVAKLAVPAMASFSSDRMMDAAFANAVALDYVAKDN
jgi:hypothetical protein